MVLSFMIVVDLPTISKGVASLSTSRLAPFYREVAPSVTVFANLFGKALQAQVRVRMSHYEILNDYQCTSKAHNDVLQNLMACQRSIALNAKLQRDPHCCSMDLSNPQTPMLNQPSMLHAHAAIFFQFDQAECKVVLQHKRCCLSCLLCPQEPAAGKQASQGTMRILSASDALCWYFGGTSSSHGAW